MMSLVGVSDSSESHFRPLTPHHPVPRPRLRPLTSVTFSQPRPLRDRQPESERLLDPIPATPAQSDSASVHSCPAQRGTRLDLPPLPQLRRSLVEGAEPSRLLPEVLTAEPPGPEQPVGSWGHSQLESGGCGSGLEQQDSGFLAMGSFVESLRWLQDGG